MNDEDIALHDIDLINAARALEILEINHKSQLQRMIKTYEIPYVKVSRSWLFLESDIQALQNSEVRQANIQNRNRKNPRKIMKSKIPFGSKFDIKKLNLIGRPEAMRILGIKALDHFQKLLERHSIPYKQMTGGYVLLRSDVEKGQNSPERQKNLKHRKKT